MEIIFHNFYFHLLLVVWVFTCLFGSFFLSLYGFVFCILLQRLFLWVLSDFLVFLHEMNILDLLRCGSFFRKIAFSYAYRPNQFNIEVFTQNDIVVKTGFKLKISLFFFIEITELKHAICDFLVEKWYLFFDTVPNATLPFGIVLFFFLKMGHKSIADLVISPCGKILIKKI